ncbi:MAG: ribonucleoside-diphosphate reductase alpha chain [Parcubacteria group bacterium Gr01-1014_48]|nr:MAG: ribonucleoside-diphosphate reductase alpha chain [Parcubacteria group bacterium Gr01-1014_48]
MLHTIKKRNGNSVAFDSRKIMNAMGRAFVSEQTPISTEDLQKMTDVVVRQVEDSLVASGSATVEGVQDVVERTIMEAGYFAVAKHYILYRYQHKKAREQETADRIEEKQLLVTKRDGKKEAFSPQKLRTLLSYHVRRMGVALDVEPIVLQCQSEVYDGITTRDVSRILIMVVRSMIERDLVYSKLAVRLLLDEINKEVIGDNRTSEQNTDAAYRKAFVENIKKAVAFGRLDERLLSFDLERISQELVIERDYLFEYLGLQTLYDRYFLRNDETKQLLETPQMFWMRVAMGSAILEPRESQEAWVRSFYDIMSEFYYTPSTPTLFHAGTTKPQLSSCYLNTVPDSLDGIFKSYSDNAQLSKWSGGIGTDWTSIRGTGSFIRGTGVESQGVIPFLKIANDVTVAINRSGRRRGAACVYLEVWHYDIFDFLELRKNTGDERRRTHDMDTAAWIPDLFMKRVRDNGQWTLFSSDEVPNLHEIYGKEFEEQYLAYEKRADRGEMKLWNRVPAVEVWKRILAMLFETGHPWVTFKDPCNIRSPQDHVGVVHSSNLCTEITLNTSANETAVCNLGSLNFAKFITNGKFDEELVGKITRVAMRMLDNVIDINYYPTADARRSNLRHRPVGLGIRGFQDALYAMGIHFDSDEAVAFADTSMEVVAYYAILASSELAKERGPYGTYKGSKWDRGLLPQDTIGLLEEERGIAIPVPKTERRNWGIVREHIRRFGMRNSNCMAIAPTATTANIVGCIPTIEPIYKNIYVKSNQAGDFTVVNKYLIEDLKTRNLWNDDMLSLLKYHDGSIQNIPTIPAELKRKYKEVFEVGPQWLIKGAAYRGRWIDQSQSLNIFFRSTSGKALSDVYFLAWEMGLKTTYYLRTLGVSQVEKSTVSTSYGATHLREKQISENVPVTETVKVEASVAVPANAQIEHVHQYTMHTSEGAICESCEG